MQKWIVFFITIHVLSAAKGMVFIMNDSIENTNGTTDSPEQPAEAVSLLQGKTVPGLNFKKALRRFAGDESAYVHILRTFTMNTRKLLVFIDSFGKEDIEEYEIKVHSMRGSCGSICADELADTATELEKAARDSDWDYISTHNKIFADGVRTLINDIDDFLVSIDSQTQKVSREKPDNAALKKLQIACTNYDMDGVDAIMEELDVYSYDSDDGLIDWLHENIELMNFPEVVERLSDITT